jgi:hypothetical protein
LFNPVLCKVIESEEKVTANGVEVRFFDWYKIHVHKKKLFKYLPISVREQMVSNVRQLVADDVKQTRLEIESLF